MIGTGFIGGKAAGMLISRGILENDSSAGLERCSGAPRFLLHRLRRVLLLHRPERLVETAHGTADTGGIFHGGQRSPRKNARRHLPRRDKGAVPADDRIPGTVPDHRPFFEPPGGLLRQRLRGQVRQLTSWSTRDRRAAGTRNSSTPCEKFTPAP